MATGLKNLEVYQIAFSLAMRIFEISKEFPKEEKYSLTDQIRRSSRSVTSNLAEAYRKRGYPAHFISKLSDADMEHTETQVWLEFCKSCKYITEQYHKDLLTSSIKIGKILDHMMKNPEKFDRNW